MDFSVCHFSSHFICLFITTLPGTLMVQPLLYTFMYYIYCKRRGISYKISHYINFPVIYDCQFSLSHIFQGHQL